MFGGLFYCVFDNFFFTCQEKIVFLQRHSRGMTGHIKDVELNVYLRHLESRKFELTCTIKQSLTSIGAYIPLLYISTAWASALLILR